MPAQSNIWLAICVRSKTLCLQSFFYSKTVLETGNGSLKLNRTFSPCARNWIQRKCITYHTIQIVSNPEMALFWTHQTLSQKTKFIKLFLLCTLTTQVPGSYILFYIYIYILDVLLQYMKIYLDIFGGFDIFYIGLDRFR